MASIFNNEVVQIQGQEQSLDRFDARTNKRLQDFLDILSGGNGGQSDLLSLFSGKSSATTGGSGYTRELAIQDTQGLTAAAVRDFQNSIVPQLQGAAEGAGASGQAITALLAQEAGIATAGQIAEKQLAQILGAEKLQSSEKIASQSNATDLLQQLLTQLVQPQRSVGGGAMIDLTGGRGTSPSRVTQNRNPAPIYGPSKSILQ